MSKDVSLHEQFTEIIGSTNQDVTQENANADGKSPMGTMGLIASAGAKSYAMDNLLSASAKKSFEDGYIHIHDFDFYATGTTTCVQVPLSKLLKGGFSTGHGFMRKPNSIMSAMALTSIILQSNQNMQHGGQAIPLFDYDLAPYVTRSYEKNLDFMDELGSRLDVSKAWELTERDVYQACEAFIHNSNSMHSRGGGQVPFISINYGMDTSFEGRMIVRNMLKATQAGLGKGETPIFPIQIFKVKEGVNTHEGDPNYDLYRLALETTSKRLFPNYLFQDAPQNIESYDGTPEMEVATMGCRTRVLSDINGRDSPIGRGNLSFTSINLPLIALEVTDVEMFFQHLELHVEMASRQLYDRYLYQSTKTADNFKFLYREGVWMDGETLAPNEHLVETLKHGTLAIGFVGLAEALVSLTGKHHGESDEAQQLGLRIIKQMRDWMDESTEITRLNYSLIATPAESYAGKALRIARDKHGVIQGVTDKEWFTNSNHVPVEYEINAYDKIRIEAPYHELTNGGHIAYVELAEDSSKNIDALETIVGHMRESGVGYGSINVPVDMCGSCGYSGVIYNECPECGNQDESNIDRIRRITGYLVGTMDKWNTAKSAEEGGRVKHGEGNRD